MRLKRLMFKSMCIMALCVGFTSCDDDDEDDAWKEGSQVQLPSNRIFILNEGIYGMNNASLTFYNPKTHEVIEDIYYTQNGVRLGDTAQDVIEYNGDLYVVMNGSSYITRLNGAGVEQARYSFTKEQGEPRYACAEDGKVYVTLYSGNVARLDAKTLAFESMVEVGDNPEQIIEEEGILYCVNSGWGCDNRLSIIDTRTFSQAEHVEIFANPQRIIEVNDKIFIQGYGGAWPDPYTYPVVLYNKQTKTTTEIGQGTHLAAYKNKLYVAFCYSEDYVNYTTKFYTYDTNTNQKSEISFLKDAPKEVLSGNIYMMEVNPENGDIYIGVTHYDTGNGDIYRFKADGTFLYHFESGGQSPNNVVFMD